ncbi:ABC transporter B family member 26, chloroplastic-like isoform X1 [Gastrolobium bilobum]|uniref:ABC transporter B family member 26, chloroplastic-like isoform X1 n=1 Tax=Gastrolobium bilobum TaxID=150636 RepID=UPI002AB15BBC|nr:ABC transporter B family member 26, chloroplastic-like isoform X1 [Gastrolobium bilobum]
MSPNLCVSHIPKWNTFYNKPQTHFLFGRSKSFRVVTPETRFRLAVSENEEAVSGFQKLLGKRVGFVASILPGGSWWTLSEHREEDAEQPTAVMLALRRMWELVADKRWVAIVAFGSLAVAALSEITMPSILAASIFSAESGETVAFSRNAFFLVLLCFTSGICSGLRSGCFGILNVTLVRRLQENLFTAILFQDISYFDKEKVGDLTSRLAADCQRLSHVIGNDLHLILRNTLQGTGAIINLLTLSWPLASSALVICSMLSAIFVVYGQYQRKAAKLTQDFTACANDVAQETISSIRIVRAYGAGKKEFGRYKQWLQRLAYINRRESVAYGFWNLSFNTLYRSTQIFAVLLGGMSVLGCCVTVEQLTKYVLYCEWLIYATWRVTNSLSSLLQSIGASEKTFQLMNLLPSDQFLAKGVKLQRLMGHIQFVNVSFHYPARMMMPVLEHLNFTVEANQVIAIVGLSGSGKSTLLNLLLRLYEPSSGQIYIDGFPLTELDIRWLRQNIGYVAQEPHLFNMDIKSNIEYGCPRKIKQEDIELAAKQASAHDFISSLPNGYETLVDDNALSGGQKQRIAIARAILRDPVIMILDEATSALDAESEHDIKEVLYALKDESKSRTIIIIAHRLSTIKAADRIFVMDDGRIIEMGNHDELLLKDGLYAKLNKIQTDILT